LKRRMKSGRRYARIARQGGDIIVAGIIRVDVDSRARLIWPEMAVGLRRAREDCNPNLPRNHVINDFADDLRPRMRASSAERKGFSSSRIVAPLKGVNPRPWAWMICGCKPFAGGNCSICMSSVR